MGREAFEILGEEASDGPFLFTCEHASNALPESVEVSAGDRELLEDHWGWDPGARDVVAELVRRVGGPAVVSTFSRLWVDPNRRPDAASLIVKEIDGQKVEFNTAIEESEARVRTREYYESYHEAVDRVGRARALRPEPFQLLSVHSFTPLYLGKARPMEIGVLFDEYDEHAWHMEEALTLEGFECALNAPYSGKPPDRLIYSAKRHGHSLGIKYLELEIRQDLIESADNAQAVGERIARALSRYLELSAPRI